MHVAKWFAAIPVAAMIAQAGPALAGTQPGAGGGDLGGPAPVTADRPGAVYPGVQLAVAPVARPAGGEQGQPTTAPPEGAGAPSGGGAGPGIPPGHEAPAGEERAPGGSAGGAGLAQALANPISSIFQYPFQNNFITGGGPNGKGYRYVLNFQPVLPFRANENWNLVVRTIIPEISQHDILPIPGTQSGISDVLQSYFFSPQKPSKGNVIWGAGPAFLYPTGSGPFLSARQWAAGPTGVVLQIKKQWLYGLLVNHLLSYAGRPGTAEVNQTFAQPFAAYAMKSGLTFSTNTQDTYSWAQRDWTSVQAQAGLSKVYNVGGQLMNFAVAGLIVPVVTPTSTTWGLGGQFTIAMVYPRLPKRPRRPASGRAPAAPKGEEKPAGGEAK